MNQTEDLIIKMQKVKLAIEEVKEHRFDTFKQKRLKLDALSKIENAILKRSKELQIDLETA